MGRGRIQGHAPKQSQINPDMGRGRVQGQEPTQSRVSPNMGRGRKGGAPSGPQVAGFAKQVSVSAAHWQARGCQWTQPARTALQAPQAPWHAPHELSEHRAAFFPRTSDGSMPLAKQSAAFAAGLGRAAGLNPVRPSLGSGVPYRFGARWYAIPAWCAAAACSVWSGARGLAQAKGQGSEAKRLDLKAKRQGSDAKGQDLKAKGQGCEGQEAEWMTAERERGSRQGRRAVVAETQRAPSLGVVCEIKYKKPHSWCKLDGVKLASLTVRMLRARGCGVDSRHAPRISL
eukprot:2553569-Rhodomonas_salina.1